MRSIRGSLDQLQPLIDVTIAAYGAPHSGTYRALIDTGATRTSITKRVIEAHGLPARGKLLVGSATNSPERRSAYGYALGLFCDTNAGERTLYVIDHEFVAPWFFDNGNFDVLIGMDIISRGTLTMHPTGEFTFAFDF